MECRECCREISKEEYTQNNGYCNKCHSNSYSNNDIVERNINNISLTIKITAIIGGIIGCIVSINLDSLYILIISILSAIFAYGFGEIIQLLEDIKNKDN